jgi:hypothetical protein
MGVAILKEGESDESESPNDTKRRCACGSSIKKAKRHSPELSRTSRHIVGRVGTGGTSGAAVGSFRAHASAHARLGQTAVHEIGRARLLPPGRSSHGFSERLRPNCLKQAKSPSTSAVRRGCDLRQSFRSPGYFPLQERSPCTRLLAVSFDPHAATGLLTVTPFNRPLAEIV